jgi:hypothetical protein
VDAPWTNWGGVERSPLPAGQGAGGAAVQDLARSAGQGAAAGVTTLAEANRFLEAYLPRYNRRFAVPPVQAADLHRPPPTAQALERSLCIKATRCLRKDFTIAHAGRLYQVHDTVRAPRVVVEAHVDGTLRITHQGRPLRVHAIAARPAMKAAEATPGPRPRRPVPPRADYPGFRS